MARRGPGRPPKRRKLPNSTERKASYATNGMLLPSFAPDKFMIYHWDPPHNDLSRLPDISPGRLDEKDRKDALEAVAYVDDGSDEWCSVGGGDELYNGNLALCIARTFVNRAKVAHRAHWSWDYFEDEELRVKTQAAARIEPNPKKPAELMAESLCEISRLEVFDRIKERLCNEIFLERYDHNRLVEGRRRQDSLTTYSAPAMRQEIAEDEKIVGGFERNGSLTVRKFEIPDIDGSKGHSLPLFAPTYKANVDLEGYRKNAWFSRYCRNCGEGLERGRCPRCKYVEGEQEA